MTNEHTQAKSRCCPECRCPDDCDQPGEHCKFIVDGKPAHHCHKDQEQALDKLIEESEKLGLYDAPEQAKDWRLQWEKLKAGRANSKYHKNYIAIHIAEAFITQLLAERDAETEKRVRAEIEKALPKPLGFNENDGEPATIYIAGWDDYHTAALKIIRGNEPTV